MNRSTSDNRINISNFLNNECVNIYVTWYRVYNFLLGGRDVEIIDLTYKTEWDILFNNQIISGNYSKIPFLVRSAALLTEIMPKASTRQGLPFRRYICKLTSSVNFNNAISRPAGPLPLKEMMIISFGLSIQTLIQDKNFFKLKSYILEVRFVAYGLFLNLFIHFYFEYYFYFTLLFKNYYAQFGQILFFFYFFVFNNINVFNKKINK